MAFSLPSLKAGMTGTVAVLDVKSGSVGGALVEFKGRGTPIIRFAYRASYSVRSDSGEASHEATMLSTLRSVAEKLCTVGLPKLMQRSGGCRGVDHVYVFLGSPWAGVRVVSKNIESKEPILISRKWMQGAIQEILGSEATTRGDATVFLEQSVIQVLLNGYPTSAPEGKRANRISVVLLEAHALERLARAVGDVMEKSFHKGRVTLRSALLASFTTIRDHFESEDNFLLVNVGSDMVEMALVREDALEGTSVLTRGSRHLVERAAELLNTVPDEAGARLRLHAEGKLDEGNRKLQTAIATIEREWQIELDRSLSELKTLRGLPLTVFLLVSPDHAAWFSALLRSPASSLHTITREPFRVVELHGEELLKHHAVEADVVPDAPLSIETLFLNRLEETHR